MSFKTFARRFYEGLQEFAEITGQMFSEGLEELQEVLRAARRYWRDVLRHPGSKYLQLILGELWVVAVLIIVWSVTIDPLLNDVRLTGESVWIARNGTFTIHSPAQGGLTVTVSSCDPFTLRQDDRSPIVGAEISTPLIFRKGSECSVYYTAVTSLTNGVVSIADEGKALAIESVDVPPRQLAVQYSLTTAGHLCRLGVSAALIFLLTLVVWVLLAVADVVSGILVPAIAKKLRKNREGGQS